MDMNLLSHRPLCLVVLAAFAALSAMGCNGDGPRKVSSPMQLEDGRALRLAWSDEFDGTTLDATKWNIETGYGEDGWGNDEWQLYTADPANVRVENGELIITARSNGTYGKRDGSITSARITTENKLNIRYGKISARIKVPASEATWPAFWMLGGNFRSVGWPRCGEIDIMEVLNRYSDEFTTHATVHWWNEDEGQWNFVGGSRDFDQPLSDGYHVYEAERTEDRIIFRIDGVTVYVRPLDMTMDELADEFFLLLNIAIGGTHGGDPNAGNFSTPQEMRVDWVRIHADPGEWNDPPDPSLTDRGIVSETHTNPMLAYSGIINTIDWSADWAASNVESTAVAPKEGAVSMQVDYEDRGAWGGGPVFQFDGADFTQFAGLTTYNALVFSINTSAMPDFDDIGIVIEDPQGQPGQAAVRLKSYDPDVSGDWKTYVIPLADFNAANPNADLTNVKFLMFLTPVNDSGGKVSGTFYLDDLHLSVRCFGADGQIQLRSKTLETGEAMTYVTILDECEANETVAVTVSNGADTISVDVTLNASGHGSAPINFGGTDDATDTISIGAGDTLTASFVDHGGNGSVRTDAASVVTSRGLVGDDDVDGAVYLYATDPAETIDMVPGVDYGAILEWGSGTTLEGAFTGDTTFSPVFSVSGTTGWGTVIAFNGFPVGFTSTYDTMRFKFKGTSEFILKFATPGAANDIELTFPVADQVYSRDLGDGWYEISLRLRETFGDGAMDNANEFAIFRVGGFTYYITDLHFE
jgi:beta-glucanase (GH16 family)